MITRMLVGVGVAVCGLAAASAAPPGSPPGPSAVEGRVEGAPELVLKREGNGCDPRFLPDTAATAFRDAAGQVHLFSTWQRNYAMVGSSLDAVKLKCDLLYEGAKKPDPAAFDDNAWLTSFYTEDGRTVHALVHDEYHGNEHPGRCAETARNRCWYNAITATVSHDGGAHFEHADPARSLVAAIPQRYGELTMPAGVFEPTNIVRANGHYYVLASQITPGKGRAGTCLLRTDDLSAPSSWRGWDGADFTVPFADPYSPQGAAAGRCVPLAPEVLKWHVTSVAHYAKKNVFIALMQANTVFPKGAVSQDGVYLMTSPDLVRWSRISLLMAAPGKFSYACGGAEPIAHPALLDPQAPDRNFTEVGDQPYLYYTQDHPANCRISTNSDLYRARLQLK